MIIILYVALGIIAVPIVFIIAMLIMDTAFKAVAYTCLGIEYIVNWPIKKIIELFPRKSAPPFLKDNQVESRLEFERIKTLRTHFGRHSGAFARKSQD